MTLAELIRSKRNELGLTQHDLARAVEVAERTVQFWEAGRRPRNGHVFALARVLGLTLEELSEAK